MIPAVAVVTGDTCGEEGGEVRSVVATAAVLVAVAFVGCVPATTLQSGGVSMKNSISPKKSPAPSHVLLLLLLLLLWVEVVEVVVVVSSSFDASSVTCSDIPPSPHHTPHTYIPCTDSML